MNDLQSMWKLLRPNYSMGSSIATEGVNDLSSDATFLEEPAFLRMLALERKRSERSNRRFALMLMQANTLLKGNDSPAVIDRLLAALCKATRETDIKGWYVERSTIGVIFTEVGEASGKTIANALLTKVTDALCGILGVNRVKEIGISFHFYPEESGQDNPTWPSSSSILYPDLTQSSRSNQALRVKRLIDIVGSLVGLLLCLPLFILIASLIKLSSRGPVFFRQERLGYFGQKFTLLKFRSMYLNNDPTIHKEFVTKLIASRGANGSSTSKPGVYKITSDPRVTRLGRILRMTSLDELPQLLNVLIGNMSLVGPRPPLAYEFNAYQAWHKRRLLGVKPGITGLWQVAGRSRVTFDEMVRLDLQYSNTWSLWLDIKILLKTPRAVFTGAGAF